MIFLSKQFLIFYLLIASIHTLGNIENDQLIWQKTTNTILNKTLTTSHYLNRSIDDNFSKRVFNLMLDKVDPNKHFFTEEQIEELKAYEYKIDNDINNNTFYFFELFYLRLYQQIEFTNSLYNTILNSPIDLNKDVKYETDFEKKTFAKNNTELKKLWEITTQYQTAQNYINLYKETYPSKNNLEIISDLEIKAKEKTKKDLSRRFNRLLEKKKKEFFIVYLDCIANAFGPHTNYLPPEEKEDFDINMTGQLEGIGAVLREDDGYIKVVRIIPGSASWRQGLLKAEDIILKVAQGTNGEEISIVETPVKEAVKLIRGPKGSIVTLIVKKPNGIIKSIPITRDIVVIKSTYAKYGTFRLPETNETEFGYIYLPSFYRDFENSSNRNAANDIKQALKKLNNTKGLILDLRSNGGGSLTDAIDISGFFIDSGPIVQVSDNLGGKKAFADRDNKIFYDKPLIIIVNTFSASASEIVSAALQDYKRAIIIGNKQTFGKGTVQKVVDLDRMLFVKKEPLGYTKITIQEYFRINGQSTQFNGVTPDIIYPSQIDYLDAGEKELDYAFRGSETTRRTYNSWSPSYNKDIVISNAKERINTNSFYQYLIDYNTFMKNKQNASNESINIFNLWKNQAEIKEKNKELEAIEHTQIFTQFTPIEPNETTVATDDEKESLKKWITNFNKDVLLNDALLILKDMSDGSSNNQ